MIQANREHPGIDGVNRARAGRGEGQEVRNTAEHRRSGNAVGISLNNALIGIIARLIPVRRPATALPAAAVITNTIPKAVAVTVRVGIGIST
ncbi:hypothetical protein D3C84_1175900 [compost metagenome]